MIEQEDAHDDTHDPGSPRLDDQLCFALYAAQRAVTAAYRPLLEELGLTYPQYLVLLVLWERGEVTVKELGSALCLDYGTVSPLLKRLEAAGLVRRERSVLDERSVSVRVTGQGAELRERAARVPGALLAATELDGGEVARLRGELWKLAERAQGAADRARSNWGQPLT
ncbi:MarR family transcriptional regulator [Streptomyces sp. ADMS]|uniref:MarR family winged helix-turn-helix transcriptional regulator n=1 Tax=Streptomyces sp. ADMS TaxID=3071415 RepID=UPI00296EFEB6|nr:MarR family transcriptional regulator [Streptomyces sp. ADMS]MDW4909646.1 MarR family transcriptional regulator [Streptomyces sp. ADMS]